MKIKVVHIINVFGLAGAEVMLCSLLERTDRERFESMVVSLLGTHSLSAQGAGVLPGDAHGALALAERVEALGIPVRAMGMRPGVPDPRGVVRLARLLHRERPQIVQTWMDHSNLIGGVAARLAARAPVIWGVHHTNYVPQITKRTTLMTVSACARLSRWLPTRIVCCSEAARATYAQRGFAAERLTVIPNGIDTDAFRPDPAARLDVRRELGLAPDATLIGLIARYAPMKDHATFLRAAAALKSRLPDVHFLLCGGQVDPGNETLASMVAELGLRGHCHLLGPRRDMPRLQASLDLATSSSVSGESFRISIGEAMACGVPCVATDVGDGAPILGETGRVVPPRDPRTLAAACRELLELSPEARARMGQSSRLHIQERYELVSITRRYEDLYETLCAGGGRSTAPVLPGAGPAPGYEASRP